MLVKIKQFEVPTMSMKMSFYNLKNITISPKPFIMSSAEFRLKEVTRIMIKKYREGLINIQVNSMDRITKRGYFIKSTGTDARQIGYLFHEILSTVFVSGMRS